MIKNYFKIALRSLARQKVLGSINILGLSLGIACFTLFLLFAVNEFNFDRFHTNSKNIFRVYHWSEAMNGEPAQGAVYMPMPLGPAMKRDFPEVKNFVRMRDAWEPVLAKIDGSTKRVRVSYADPEIFSVFNFNFKYGNAGSSLKGLNNIVVTESKGKELFGNENAIGKTVQIKIDNVFQPFTVSGVAHDLPANSSIQFDVLANYLFFQTTEEGKGSMDRWTRSGYITFVELQEGSNLPYDKNKMAAFRQKYFPDDIENYKKNGFVWDTNKLPITFGLQPLNEMHTSTVITGGVVENVDPKTIYILLGIACAILLIACINFTTLAIGRSAGRSKEVGVRKVIGAQKKQLVFQFLSEALLLSVLSTVLGLLLAKFLLPYFNHLSGRVLQFSFSQYPEMIGLLIGLVFLVGVMSGAYPALVLSAFKPIEVLKSKIKIGGSNLFTKSLVTLQFAVSIALIISTVIILKQVKYMRTKNPGFNKENVVVIDAAETNTKKIFPLIKQTLSENPQIAGVAGIDIGIGGDHGYSTSGFNYDGKPKNVFEYFIDNEFINVMGMQLLAGRNFNSTIASDSVTAVIVNEAMMKDFGWTLHNAVGQQIKGYHESKTPVVIGVVKDFNFRSLSQAIAPQMFHQFAGYAPYKFMVRIKPGNPAPVLDAMQKAWSNVVADVPFKYSFIDEDLYRFYKAEQRWSSIVGWAGGISIFLACLGLFGLAALAAVNRTKEIGIRKVLGASVTNIINLLSKDFLKLIAIALVIASPLAWYFMHNWLQDFAYRINIGWSIFFITGFIVVLAALLTISFQAVKAAIANPVKSLRAE